MRFLTLFIPLLLISFNSVSQAFNWVETIGLNGGGNDYGHDITPDEFGHIYATGLLKNESYAGSGSDSVYLAPYGEHDIYIAKYNQNSTLLWAKRFGTPQTEFGHRINLDTSLNLYLVGEYETTFSLTNNSVTAAGDHNVFVSKLDTAGNDQWIVGMGGTGSSCYADDAYTDVDGNTYVLGRFLGSIVIGSTTLTTAGNFDVFACKIDPSGTVKWARRYGGSQRDEGSNIILNSVGELVVNGIFTGTAGFDGNSLVSQGNLDAWLAELDSSNGDVDWILSMGSNQNDFARGMSVGSDNSIYVSGNFWNTLNISNSTNTYTSSGGTDIFHLKFNTNGTLQWGYSYGGPLCNEQPFAMDVNSDENSLIAFLITDNSVINGQTIPLVGVRDWVFLEVGNDGQTNWFQAIDGYPYAGKDPSVNRVKYDDCGSLLITGGFLNTVDFNPFSVAANGTAADVYIARLLPQTPMDTVSRLNVCSGDLVDYSIPGSCYLDSFSFTLFGNDTITFPTGYINQAFTNNYDLEYVFHYGSQSDTLHVSDFVSVQNPPALSLGADTTICENSSLLLSPGSYSSYLWSDSSDGNTLLVSDSGIYYVTVSNQYGCKSTDSIIVDTMICNSISEHLSYEVTLFPNPAENVVQIVSNTSDPIARLQLFNAAGKLVGSHGRGVSVFDVRNYEPGIYFVLILSNSGRSTMVKLIKH